MKRQLLLASAILFFVNTGIAFGGGNALQKFMRWTGYGMGDGYHTCPCPPDSDCQPACRRVFSAPVDRPVPYSSDDCGCARRSPDGSFGKVARQPNQKRRELSYRSYQARNTRKSEKNSPLQTARIPQTTGPLSNTAADTNTTRSAWLSTYDVRVNN